MKHRLFALLSAAVLTACAVRITVSANPYLKCGNAITWDYDGDTKTLSITGTGAMFDFSEASAVPWEEESGEIEQIEISDGITSIGQYAFYGMKRVTELHLPDSVTEIGDYACADMETLQSADMPANLRVLGDNAFYFSKALTRLVLPEGLESIGENCFACTYSLAELNVPDSVKYIGACGLTDCALWNQIQAENGDFLIVGDGILYQYYCTYLSDDGSVTVPDGVKSIVGNAFGFPLYVPLMDWNVVNLARNKLLHHIILPDSVQRIDANTFADLTTLESVRLPAQLTEIADGLFSGCRLLTSVNIPETVEKIGNRAFFGCESLAELDIPVTVGQIGTEALYGTKWLSDLHDFMIFGDGYLYSYTGRDKIVDIPENVSTICSRALNNRNILEVRIPDTVKKLEDKAVNCPDALIVGKKGSAAERYAAENGLAFRSADAAAPAETDMTLDFSRDIWSFGNARSVFGERYYISNEDLEALRAQNVNTDGIIEEFNTRKLWEGSCVGLSITVILAKNGLFRPEQLQPGATSLAETEPSETVLSFINYYQATQGRTDRAEAQENKLPMFYRLVNLAANVQYGESPALIVFATETGSHGVVGYGQEDGSWRFDGKRYDARILLWDSNFPNALHEESCIYYDKHTLDYCIPYYGIHVAEGAADNTAGIFTVCNDTDILNAYPHALAKTAPIRGDINSDGRLTVADAILLARVCAEDPAVQRFDPQDLDGDGLLTVTDVTEILKMLAGKAA